VSSHVGPVDSSLVRACRIKLPSSCALLASHYSPDFLVRPDRRLLTAEPSLRTSPCVVARLPCTFAVSLSHASLLRPWPPSPPAFTVASIVILFFHIAHADFPPDEVLPPAKSRQLPYATTLFFVHGCPCPGLPGKEGNFSRRPFVCFSAKGGVKDTSTRRTPSSHFHPVDWCPR